MRKNLYLGLIACAALTMTGCSNDEVSYDSPKQEDQPIQFGTYVGRDVQGRASLETTATIANKGFGVFAYYTKTDNHGDTHKPDFMYNQKVTSEDGGTNWAYTPVKYWPNNTNDQVSFFAYAPYSTGSTNNITLDEVGTMTTPQITFAVHNTVQSQTDLLYADQTEGNKTYDQKKQAIEGKISFKFQHALARIGFTVRAIVDGTSGNTPLDENTKIYVKKVMLMKNDAEDYDGTTDDDEHVFYTDGVLNLKSSLAVTAANWTSRTGAQALTIATGSSDDGDFETCSGTTVTPQTGGSEISTWGLLLNKTNSATAQKLNNDKASMMIIPQDLSSEGFRIYVEYDVVTKENWEGAAANNDNIVHNKITTKNVKINFQSGKAYTINLQLGMTSVKVGADVGVWSPETPETSADNPANKDE